MLHLCCLFRALQTSQAIAFHISQHSSKRPRHVHNNERLLNLNLKDTFICGSWRHRQWFPHSYLFVSEDAESCIRGESDSAISTCGLRRVNNTQLIWSCKIHEKEQLLWSQKLSPFNQKRNNFSKDISFLSFSLSHSLPWADCLLLRMTQWIKHGYPN